jgi:hypothetical protein
MIPRVRVDILDRVESGEGTRAECAEVVQAVYSLEFDLAHEKEIHARNKQYIEDLFTLRDAEWKRGAHEA